MKTLRTCSISKVVAGILSVGAIAFAAAAPAHANETPDFSHCEGFPLHPEAENEPKQALSLPVAWSDIAASTRNWIAVTTDYHTTYCVSTQWMLHGSDFERFGERFLGFRYEGMEFQGYMLIDRAGQGYAIDTGVRPHFSPDDTKFAVLNRADTGIEGFDGFAIWQTWGETLRPYIVKSGPRLSPMFDWRIEAWDGENCLHISAVHYDDLGGDWDKLPDAPRYSYVAYPANDWQIAEGETCPNVD